MIDVDGLTKRYGDTLAVDAVTFTAAAGRVTGFLGPNGAGKSTTMRLLLGLERPDAGSARVNGRQVTSLASPLREVGALLDNSAALPSLSVRTHLRALAATQRIPAARVDEVLGLVGLTEVATTRVRTFSLGMRQRLGVATALLGDPPTVVLDEPINGLDPEGVIWIRQLLRSLAADGRCVLLSSHVMAEVAMTADEVVMIGRGRILEQGTIGEVLAGGRGSVRVVAEEPTALRALADRAGWSTAEQDGGLQVQGVDAVEVGRAARDAGLVLAELTPVRASLEERYLDITDSSTRFRAGHATGVDAGPEPTEPDGRQARRAEVLDGVASR